MSVNPRDAEIICVTGDTKQQQGTAKRKNKKGENMAEEKCGFGCKLAKAKNKIVSSASNAYNAYNEYKTTNARYASERVAKRAAPSETYYVEEKPERVRKTEYVQEKQVVYVPVQKKQSLGSKIYNAIGTAAQNLNENYPEPLSFYSRAPPKKTAKAPAGYRLVKTAPKKTATYRYVEDDDDEYVVVSPPKKKAKKTVKAPAGYRLVRTAPKTRKAATYKYIEEDDDEYVIVSAPKRRTTKRSAPAGYRLVRTTTKRKTTKRKTTKPKAPKGYRLVKTTPKRITTKPKAPKGYKYVRM